MVIVLFVSVISDSACSPALWSLKIKIGNQCPQRIPAIQLPGRRENTEQTEITEETKKSRQESVNGREVWRARSFIRKETTDSCLPPTLVPSLPLFPCVPYLILPSLHSQAPSRETKITCRIKFSMTISEWQLIGFTLNAQNEYAVKLTQLLSPLLRLRGHYHTKTAIAVANVGCVSASIGNVAVPSAVNPRTASHDAVI